MLLMSCCCWCPAAVDALMLLMLLMRWCCWCADADEALMLLMYWCSWCTDALMLLNQDQDLLADLSIAICSSFHCYGTASAASDALIRDQLPRPIPALGNKQWFSGLVIENSAIKNGQSLGKCWKLYKWKVPRWSSEILVVLQVLLGLGNNSKELPVRLGLH